MLEQQERSPRLRERATGTEELSSVKTDDKAPGFSTGPMDLDMRENL